MCGTLAAGEAQDGIFDDNRKVTDPGACDKELDEGRTFGGCYARFGHKRVSEYREYRGLGNIFEEPIVEIWRGARYQALRRAFESDHPARHGSACGLSWSD